LAVSNSFAIVDFFIGFSVLVFVLCLAFTLFVCLGVFGFLLAAFWEIADFVVCFDCWCCFWITGALTCGFVGV